MSNDIAKALKQKTDAMLRLQGQSQKPVVYENVDGSYTAPEKSDYTAALAQGKNIEILVSGSIKTISAVMNLLAGNNITISEPDENGAVTVSGSIAGKEINIADFTGKDGYSLTYDEANDKFILSEIAGGGTISQATETILGGIKAKARTTESLEAAIDSETGKLYIPSVSGGGMALPDFMIQDADGIKIYTSEAKDSLIAVLGKAEVLDDSITQKIALIPKMTGNNTPSGIVTYSTSYSVEYDGWKAFDELTTLWIATASNGWIAYEFPSNEIVNQYMIEARSTDPARSPKNWTFEGFDGEKWIVLDTRVNIINWIGSEKREFSFSNAIAYKKYRLNVIVNNSGQLLSIQNIQFYRVGGIVYKYGIFTEQYMRMAKGYILPSASETYRGQIFTLIGGTGVADIAYVCVKNTVEGYEWRAI